MSFPIRPTDPLPTWATNVDADKTDPGSSKRNTGWQYNSTQSNKLGETIPYSWQNYNKNIIGIWSNYFDQISTYINNVITNDFKSNIIVAYSSVQRTLSNNLSILNFDTIQYSNLSNPSNYFNGTQFIASTPDIYGYIKFDFLMNTSVPNPSLFSQISFVVNMIYNSNIINITNEYNMSSTNICFSYILYVNTTSPVYFNSIGSTRTYGSANYFTQLTISWNF